MARSIDAHRPDCGCNVCRHRGSQTSVLTVRLTSDLRDWAQAKGAAWLRALLERERAAESRE